MLRQQETTLVDKHTRGRKHGSNCKLSYGYDWISKDFYCCECVFETQNFQNIQIFDTFNYHNSWHILIVKLFAA